MLLDAPTRRMISPVRRGAWARVTVDRFRHWSWGVDACHFWPMTLTTVRTHTSRAPTDKCSAQVGEACEACPAGTEPNCSGEGCAAGTGAPRAAPRAFARLKTALFACKIVRCEFFQGLGLALLEL